MRLFRFETILGHVGLVAAESASSAEHEASLKVGLADNAVRSVRPATDEDVAWVRRRGGYVPPISSHRDPEASR